MDPNVQPDVSLYTIDETYPDSSQPDLGCKNGAQTVSLGQNYYNCFQNSAPGTVFRVTKETHQSLTTLPYYQQRITCEVEEVFNDVCYCASGFTGALCDTT